MIELLDPKNINPVAYEKGVLQDICEYSLLPDKRIGWNYCMDYTWVAMRCDSFLKPGMVVVDIGCGPGAIHGYLEKRCKIDIIGIDLHHWQKDYVDITGDFTNRRLRKKYGFVENSIDCILSISAFEHNRPAKHRRIIQTCFSCLKPEGRLITTFAAAKNKTSYFSLSKQWNLSNDDIYNIYGEKVENFSQYDKIWQQWHHHRYIPGDFKSRYGSWNSQDPPFLSVGAEIVKTKAVENHEKKNHLSFIEKNFKKIRPRNTE